jgi:hypothetical protein
MKQEDIEKAWAKLSMHNSELLLRVAELERQLERQLHSRSIRNILRARIRAFFGKNT